MGVLKAMVLLLRALLVPKVHLAYENLALRQQLAVLRQSAKRPRLRRHDRVFCALLSRLSLGPRSRDCTMNTVGLANGLFQDDGARSPRPVIR